MGTSPVNASASPRSFLATILIKAGTVTADDLQASADRSGRKMLWESLLDDRLISEDQLAETLARYLHLPCVRLASTTIPSGVAERIPESFASKHTCVPVKLEGNDTGKGGKAKLLVAMADPTDLSAL